VVEHSWNSSTREAETGVQGQPWLYSETLTQKISQVSKYTFLNESWVKKNCYFSIKYYVIARIVKRQTSINVDFQPRCAAHWLLDL
jgi:hypothetical protein